MKCLMNNLLPKGPNLIQGLEILKTLCWSRKRTDNWSHLNFNAISSILLKLLRKSQFAISQFLSSRKDPRKRFLWGRRRKSTHEAQMYHKNFVASFEASFISQPEGKKLLFGFFSFDFFVGFFSHWSWFFYVVDCGVVLSVSSHKTDESFKTTPHTWAKGCKNQTNRYRDTIKKKLYDLYFLSQFELFFVKLSDT